MSGTLPQLQPEIAEFPMKQMQNFEVVPIN